jgi:hypothetical protein
MAVFTVPPTLQSFGEVVAQKFETPESRALPTFASAEAGNATPKTAFRSLELAVPTRSCRSPFSRRMTAPCSSPVVRCDRDERRAPENAVIAARASRGGD